MEKDLPIADMVRARMMVPDRTIGPYLTGLPGRRKGVNAQASAQNVNAAQDTKKRRAGRKKGSGSLADSDSPLLEDMENLIAGGEVASVWAAAMKMSDKATGAGTPNSKAKRLAGRYEAWKKTNSE